MPARPDTRECSCRSILEFRILYTFNHDAPTLSIDAGPFVDLILERNPIQRNLLGHFLARKVKDCVTWLWYVHSLIVITDYSRDVFPVGWCALWLLCEQSKRVTTFRHRVYFKAEINCISNGVARI